MVAELGEAHLQAVGVPAPMHGATVRALPEVQHRLETLDTSHRRHKT